MIEKFVKFISVAPKIFRSSFKLGVAFDMAASGNCTGALRTIEDLEEYGLEPNGEQLTLKALCLSHCGQHEEAVAAFTKAWEVWRFNEKINPDEITYLKMFIDAHYGENLLPLSEDRRVTDTFSKHKIPARFLRQFVFEMNEEDGDCKLRS